MWCSAAACACNESIKLLRRRSMCVAMVLSGEHLHIAGVADGQVAPEAAGHGVDDATGFRLLRQSGAK